MDLETLRSELTELDTEIVRLAARRQQIVSEIGKVKQQVGRGTRDFKREKVVIETARANARQFGVPPQLAEQIMQALIRSSLTRQEQDMVMATGQGEGKHALVIGGKGKLGGWFVSFLSSQGYSVQVADPDATEYGSVSDWRDARLDQDLIVVAAPIKVSNDIMLQLADLKPEGLVFDLASVKKPVREGLEALHKAGCKVTSLHPMFGPDTRLLSGRHVIFSNVGNAEATREARALFDSTMVQQVEMDLELHDRLIAYVLGLSHALNIAFFTVLAESGESAEQLAKMSSTTFDAQLEVASRVSRDNPGLYFEIQQLNEYRDVVLESLQDTVKKIREMVDAGDEAGFASMMEKGREYLASRPDEG